jgi:multiple sugar transport system substrate-binding protein
MRGTLAGLVTAVLAIFGASSGLHAASVEIDYWQYFFKERVEAMDALIKQFEAANPDIKVKQTTFPYADYQTKVAAAIPAGEGPDLVQLYYGWLAQYMKAGLLQKLPSDAFNAAEIDRDFFPIVRNMKIDGEYYALPTAVRSLALFWNKKLFKDAGLDPEKPPQTLDELVEMAHKLTQRDAAGNLVVEGMTADLTMQDQHWVREVLVRQFGGQPYSDDNRTVAYDDAAGIKAVSWYADLIRKEKVAEIGFLTDQPTAFKSGKAAITIDGSFRLGAFDGQKGLEYGVAELPAYNGKRSNFSSYWVNGITSKAKDAKRDAAVKFLKFVTTPEAMELWLHTVGELPARVSVAAKESNRNDPKYGPFIRGLDYAHATDFVDELAQRKVMIDIFDRITLQQTSPADAVHTAAEEEQKILDANHKK